VEGVRAAVTALCLFCALASKEVALAFVVALALGTPWREQRRRAPAILALGGPVVLWATLRSIALVGKGLPSRDLGVVRRLGTVLEAIARYVEMTLDPLRPRTCIGILGEVDVPRAVLGGVLLAGLVAVALRLHRPRHAKTSWPRPEAAMILGLGGASLALVLHVIPFTLAGSVAADRLLYVPLAALALGLSVGVSNASERFRRTSGVLALAAAGTFAFATRARIADYADETLFWTIAAEDGPPHNTTPWMALGSVLRDAGDVDRACRLFEHASRTLDASERAGLAAHRRARENLANCWLRNGREGDALALDEALAREYPEAGRIQMAVGFARLAARDFDGAEAAFGRSITLDDKLRPIAEGGARAAAEARREWRRFERESERERDPLGWAEHLARIGRAREADAAFAAIAHDPTVPAEARQSAVAYLRERKSEERHAARIDALLSRP
jgi:hypothetical protein